MNGCRPAWNEIPLWQFRLVPRRDEGVTTLVGVDTEMSRGCHMELREMFPM
jgi:hypothetical protein